MWHTIPDSNIGVGGSLRKRVLRRDLPFKIKLERRPLGSLIDIEVHSFDATISRYDSTRADVFGKVTRLALFRKESRHINPSGWDPRAVAKCRGSLFGFKLLICSHWTTVSWALKFPRSVLDIPAALHARL